MSLINLEYQSNHQIAIITLNRPEVHHAINEEMMSLLENSMDQIEQRKETPVIILTASGNESFCAGGDVSPVKQGGEKVLEMNHSESIRRYERAHALEVTRHLRRLEIPVIAMVNGVIDVKG